MASQPIVHIEIPASDTKAAGRFYAEAVGWQIHTDPAYDYTMFSAEGGPGGGFVNPGGAEGPVVYDKGKLLVYIGSDDVDASLNKVQSLGGKVITPKTEIPNVGWFGVFEDPFGNRLAFYKAMQPAG